MTAMNLNRAVRGPITAVPVVAGNGVRFVQDVQNNRVVAEADETVLWEGTGWSVGDTGQTFTLSESPLNFETIRVYGYRPLGTGSNVYSAVFSEEFDPNLLSTNSITSVMMSYSINNNGNRIIGGMGISGVTGTSWTEAGGFHFAGGSLSNGEYAHVHKVVGINRIAST